MLEDIKSAIITKVGDINTEKKWVHDVFRTIKLYEEKVKGVVTNLRMMQKEVKALLVKKKKIEAAILKEKLNSKLDSAKDDLQSLDQAISGVHAKKKTFQETKSYLEKRISNLEKKISGLAAKGSKISDDAEDEAESSEESNSTDDSTKA
mmetsp:Transcript_21483/g.38105  ORF Transcript_21483/g.38105 Transcript_21483/m.38105 type:complete len:150 (+) Transcript_21483:456-905(+)